MLGLHFYTSSPLYCPPVLGCPICILNCLKRPAVIIHPIIPIRQVFRSCNRSLLLEPLGLRPALPFLFLHAACSNAAKCGTGVSFQTRKHPGMRLTLAPKISRLPSLKMKRYNPIIFSNSDYGALGSHLRQESNVCYMTGKCLNWSMYRGGTWFSPKLTGMG